MRGIERNDFDIATGIERLRTPNYVLPNDFAFVGCKLAR